MIEKNTRVKVLQTLKSLPFLTQNDLEDLPKSKNSLWKEIRKHIEMNLKYSFEEDFFNEINKVLTEVDGILSTQETQKIKKKRERRYGNLSELLGKIMSEYEEVFQQEMYNKDQFLLKQRILQSVFESELRRFTYFELSGVVQKKLEKLKEIKLFRMTEEQKDEFKACRDFKEFFDDIQFDLNAVDGLIQTRIQQGPEYSLNSSGISEIASRSYDTLRSFTDESMSQMSTNLQELVNIDEYETIYSTPMSYNTPQGSELFVKKENSGIAATTLPSQKEKFTQEQSSNKFNEKQKQIEFNSISRSKSENTSVSTQLTSASSQLTSKRTEAIKLQPVKNLFSTNLGENTASQSAKERILHTENDNLNESESDITISVNQSFLQEEDRKQNEANSEQIIKRYESQNRFTEGKYRAVRELEVKQIEIQQLNPLIHVLKRIPIREIDKYSPYNQEIQNVQVYGSFANKCGFRKLSDININLTIEGLKEGNMHSSLFNLRNLLDNYRKNGILSQLNLRSVIYSQEDGEVILSHINNQSKIREEKVVNYIYLTINRKQFVLSSTFMKSVIYNNQDKSRNIAHLTNYLHLLFRRNFILDYKDMYHTWWTTTYQEKMKKEKSQSKYVSISVYSLQMMVLYYLQETGKISKIQYSEDKKTYDFEIRNPFITLFENFVGFLNFYSSQGSYKKLYAKTCIDVVDRLPHEEAQIQEMINKNSHKIELQEGRNLFVFIHPMTSDLIKVDNGQNTKNYISFEILRGSEKEKLFFQKIDRMLDIVTKLRPNERFDPEALFENFNSQFN